MIPAAVKRGLLLWLAAMALLAVAACGGSEDRGGADGTGEVTRQDVLASLTGLVIVPRYRQAAESSAALAASSRSLCSAPSLTGLEEARASWVVARITWVATEAFRFGPGMDRRSASLVDWWPVEPDRIDEVVAKGEPVSPETVRQFMPSTRRGFAAMEHLLYGPGIEDLSGPEGASRCAYLAALAGAAHEEIDGILREWEGETDTDGYAGFFDGSALSSLHPREGEAEVVRSLVFMVRTIANMRLGAALGVDGEADPAAIPEGAAGFSGMDLQFQLQSISEMYSGAVGNPDGLGIGNMVHQLSPEVDGRMRAAIEGVVSSLDGVEGSLQSAVASNPESVREVYDRMKELQRVLNTEIVSLLGVSVGFSDTDGDS